MTVLGENNGAINKEIIAKITELKTEVAK